MLNPNIHKRIQKFIGLAPIIIPAIISVVGLFCMLLLLLGRLDSIIVYPISLALAILTALYLYKNYEVDRVGTKKEQSVTDIAVIVGVVVWLLVNMLLTSQNVFVRRDPGIYTVAGAWLKDNSQLQVKIDETFGGNNKKYLEYSSSGFGYSRLNKNEIFTQGQHLLPVFLGLFARMTNDAAMLHLNPLFGATALLAIYGFSRIFIRPRFAALGILAVSLCLPMLYVSRDTFSEPLTATFVFGALSLLWWAQSSKKQRLISWFFSGLVFGAAALTRIDSYILYGGLAAFTALYISLSQRNELKLRLEQSFIFISTIAIVALVGWLDVTRLASGYYEHLGPRFKLQVYALAAIVVIGLITSIIISKTGFLKRIDAATKKWRVPMVLGLLVIILAVLISRPFWLESHHSKSIPLVGGLQAAEGSPVDPTRDYAEQTINWLAWYLGPLLVIMSGFGIFHMVKKSMSDKSLLYVPFLFSFIAMSAVFLNRPSITPDQVWATRRFIPIILPGAVLLGVYAFDLFLKKYKKNIKSTVFTWSTAVLTLLPIVFISYPFLAERTYIPQYAQIGRICSTLPSNSAVVWVGQMIPIGNQTTRAFCDVPTVGLNDVSESSLQKVAKDVYSSGKTPIIGTDENDYGLMLKYGELSLVSAVRYRVMPSNLYNPPRVTTPGGRTVYMGVLNIDGSISKIKDAQ